ncbi:MAG: MFS family permease [Gammaproteobacteria bacterium]|jgi:MFS family permease
MSAGRLVALMCTAQVLAQIGAYTWPALLPGFFQRWPMDNTQAGWITGAFYGAYMLSVPFLVGITDRIDPRKVYLFGVTLTTFSHLGFALFADGVTSALIFRVLAGIGWAGTYMTGLKLLSDRIDDKMMSRAVSGHAAGVGIAGGLSFAFAGALQSWLGWQGAFVIAAACSFAALLIAWLLLPAAPRTTQHSPGLRLSLMKWLPDFRPVLANRSAIAYSAAYCVHTWEMNALRGWSVAFLAFVAGNTSSTLADGWLTPVIVVTAMGLLGTGASVIGNELAMAYGRARLVRRAMLFGSGLAIAVGILGTQSYALASSGVLLYAIVIWLDSSALTAGAAGNAEPGRRGATLALHSMLGYAGGFIGPVMMGWLLDVNGGMSAQGWIIAFAHLGVIGLIGRMLFARLGPGSVAGDQAH